MKCPVHLLAVFAFTMTGCPQPPPAEPDVSPQDVLDVTEVPETAGDGAGDVGPEAPPWPECGPDVPGKVDPAADQHPPILHSDDFLAPQPLPCPMSTAGGEDSPFILPDGDTLYFWHTPDVSVPPEEQVIDGVTGIYVTRKTDGAWSTPERVVLSDDIALDGCVFVQGPVMWFCSIRAGNLTDIDMYVAALEGDVWGGALNAGALLNVDYEIEEMHLSLDGRFLYFHSGRDGGKGGVDIWVSELEDGQWQEPVNLEAVNSPEDDSRPFLSADSAELWFTRTHQGTPAVFRAVKKFGAWQPPEMIVSRFAGEPSLDSEGNLYFTHHYYDTTGPDAVMLEADSDPGFLCIRQRGALHSGGLHLHRRGPHGRVPPADAPGSRHPGHGPTHPR